jgi:hypothetical protein
MAASGPRIVVEGGALDDLLSAALERQSVLPYFQLDGSNCSDEKVPHLVEDLAHQLVSGKKLEGDKPSVDSTFSMVAQKACAFSPQARAARLRRYQMMASASTCPLLEGIEEV